MPEISHSDNEIVLEVRNVVKTFPGVRALDHASFQLKKREVHALIGENGAGKSTLIHILAGVHQADSAEIYLHGKRVSFPNPHSATTHAIAVVFQELSLTASLSVAENIFAHRQPLKYIDMIDRKRLYAQTKQMLQLFELQIDPRSLVRNLSAAEQQLIEILKAISQNPEVLILDEPTSSLSATHVKLLFRTIKQLKKQGLSVIYISHHLREIFDVADRVTVLRDGKYVQTCQVCQVGEEDLVRKMVGREVVDMYGIRTTQLGEEIFRAEGLGRAQRFHDISFSVRKNEIVGLAGLAGAGRTELARAIFGLESFDAGQMVLNKRPIEPRSPEQAISSRIAYVTEDRRLQGLFLRASIQANCAAPSLKCFANKLGLIDDKAITTFAQISCNNLNIVTPNVRQRVGNLSGGNQQKVLLSMWFGIQPLLLIVDEPTRGVDIGAKSEIYHLLRDLAARGVGIMMISSDLPEILGLSDRILVMRNGRLAGEFNRQQATEENIIACATGVYLQ